MLSLTWHGLAPWLLLAAVIFHLLAALGVRAGTNWSEAAWACATAAGLCLLL